LEGVVLKNNEKIVDLIHKRQFDGVRYASVERLTFSRIDAQAWTFLGQAMVGLKRGEMAKHCFERALLLDPSAAWGQQALQAAKEAGEGREDKQVLKLLEGPYTPVSACILTRNNSRTIRKCIESLLDAVDEIVVVDTGSSDDTISIVESLGISTHNFEWIDDFSAARNYAQSLTTNDWIISVDSDEILVREDVPNIRIAARLFKGINTALMVTQLNKIGNTTGRFSTGRMYQKSSGMHWIFPIHESLETKEGYQCEKLQTYHIRVRLFHEGYDPCVVPQEEKLRRNVRIIESVLGKDPHNALFLFYLGRELNTLGDYQRALKIMVKAQKYAEPHLEITSRIPKLIESIQKKISRSNEII
jgi:tetratricopeptide (TPR) repeat protein